MDLDRPLRDLADSYRPDRQPPLDDLVTRARARRRTAVVVASASSVVLLALGVAVAVDTRGGSHVVEPVAPTTTTPPGCDVKPFGGVVDYIDFVRVGGLSMDRQVDALERTADLGATVQTVTCQLDDHSEEVTKWDGTASFLRVGTAVRAVRGFDPRCRVAAVQDGQVLVYLAEDPTAHVATPAACSLMPGVDPGGPTTAPGDVRSAPSTYQQREQLPDCGSLDRRKLGQELDPGGQAARACFLAARGARRPAEVRMALATIDAGPRYEVLRTQDGGVEAWQSGYRSTTGPHGDTYWLHFRCTGVSAGFLAEACGSAIP